MPYSLPRSSAVDQHVDPAGVLAFVDAMDARPDIEMHSFMLVRHGHVVAEGWWRPYSAYRVHLLYSLSKSFTSTAAAFAQAEGLLDLDDTILKHFPEFDADITNPNSRAMRIRHVASMTSGRERETRTEALERDPKEPVRGFLLIPPDRPPGTVFAYNQPCTYTLASIIQRNSGMPLTRYLRSRLFDPLGIGEVGWSTLAGREQGYRDQSRPPEAPPTAVSGGRFGTASIGSQPLSMRGARHDTERQRESACRNTASCVLVY